jgi:hypothetical protein
MCTEILMLSEVLCSLLVWSTDDWDLTRTID